MRIALFVAICLIADGNTVFAQTSPDEWIAAGHWKRARDVVEARYRQTPSDPALCFYMSQIRNAFGDRESPLPLAEKAVALDGRTARYHRQLAEVLGVTAQHSNLMQQILLARRFRRELDTALALDPRDVQAQRDLLEFYLLAPGLVGGDLRKAGATSDRLMQLDAVEGFLAQARVAEYQKRSQQVEADLRQAVASGPSSYKARIALARFYLNAASPHWDEAAAEALHAVALDRGRIDAYVILASVYAERENWSALEDLLKTAKTEVPDDLSPYYRAAERLENRNAARAQSYLEIYLSQPPEGNEPTADEARAKLGLVRQREVED